MIISLLLLIFEGIDVKRGNNFLGLTVLEAIKSRVSGDLQRTLVPFHKSDVRSSTRNMQFAIAWNQLMYTIL